MRTGVVLGAVWCTRKCPALSGQTLLRVRAGDTELIAADLVGAGTGDYVLLSSGGAARLPEPAVPIDTAVVGILDAADF